MQENIIESVFQKTNNKPILPIFSMFISLFNIVFLQSEFQDIIILFVCEITLMLVFAIIRMLFALNEMPFYETAMQKVILLIGGIFIGILFVVFSVMFMSESIRTDIIFSEIRKIKYQIYLLIFGYFSTLIFHYFGNQKFRTAAPMAQMLPFFQVLTILAILQGFTGHLFIEFKGLNHAVAGVVALVIVKFLVDLLFSFIQNPAMFSNKKEITFQGKEYITTSKIDDSSHTITISER